MHTKFRWRALIKFLFWAVATIVVGAYAINTYTSGQLVRWYYFESRADGYAVNTKGFEQATREQPVYLTIGAFSDVRGLRAARVTKGSRLPEGTNGVVDLATVDEGTRVRLDRGQLVVSVPWQIKEAKGFKFRDGFTHKNIRTNPYAGLWNLIMVGLVGLCLGFLAEGFTDLVGLKFQKIDHSVGH
ncbi:MAG: hypothetical protein NTV05_02660 [Acidobacteria bacterium]|nr:hypothetical protein [Acidobacteriota bacterium]